MTAASADLTSLLEKLSASNQNITRMATELIRSTAEKVRSEAISKAPFKTGALRNSISVSYDGPLRATVGPHVPYGVYQEFGTGTRGEFPGQMYEIRPKNPNGRLVFKTKDGKWVSAKLVRHPGIPPRPYMRPALTEALGDSAAKLASIGALSITKGSK
jgi:hypothetical protein